MGIQPKSTKLSKKEIIVNFVLVISLIVIFTGLALNMPKDKDYDPFLIPLLKITRVETEETKNTNEILYQLLKHCLDENNNILNRCK